MRRAWLLVASSALMIAVGCGRDHYEKRLENTLAELKYERRVRTNLMPPPTDKKFPDLAIYIQAPKDEAPAKTGQLPVAERQFDLDASFNDKTEAALHVLARVKLPKKAPTKGAPPAPAPAARGEFSRDVLGVLSSVFGSVEALDAPKFVDDVHGRPNRAPNRFKRLIFNANDKEVKVYIYKQDNHEVALIFIYDPKLKQALDSKIVLCLENFATGARATRSYNGGASEEEGEPGTGPAVPL